LIQSFLSVIYTSLEIYPLRMTRADLEPPLTEDAPPNIGSLGPLPSASSASPSLHVRGERALATDTVRVEGLGRNKMRSEPVSDTVTG